tara:strand:- start:1153 stop:1752 length:600 start_codon:yes stop_codon:yes gene_type:complete
MRFTLIISFFFITISTWSQSNIEQSLYSNKIWKEVPHVNGEIRYFDSADVFLGGKRTNTKGVFYFDHRQRTIKVIRSKQVHVKPIHKKKSKKIKLKSNKRFIKHGNYYVKTKRNKTQYFDDQGNLIRTVRKKGNTIYYKNSEGGLLGYKKLGNKGFVEYRDVRGRKTGTSYLNSAGFVVYKQYKRRRTPAFMISDAYFF